MEKPILFNTEMVKAILEGRKTVTRRLVKPQTKNAFRKKEDRMPKAFWTGMEWVKSPYQPGDLLYVRETWLKADDGYYYKTDIKVPSESEDIRKAYGYKWHPSIHMPKEAARIWLRITEVHVERLQDITINDIAKEGFSRGHAINETWYDRGKKDFQKLWDSTVKDIEAYGWDANPWVWVIEFERLEGYKSGR